MIDKDREALNEFIKVQELQFELDRLKNLNIKTESKIHSLQQQIPRSLRHVEIKK